MNVHSASEKNISPSSCVRAHRTVEYWVIFIMPRLPGFPTSIVFQRGGIMLSVNTSKPAKIVWVFLLICLIGIELQGQELGRRPVSYETDVAPAKLNHTVTVKKVRLEPIDTIEEYREAIAENPKDAINFNNLAELYFVRGMYAEAREALEHAVALNPAQAQIYINLSRLYSLLGRDADALRPALLAVAANPSSQKARFHLCTMYQSLKRYIEAVDCYEILRPMTPNDPVIMASYGMVLLAMGSPEKVIKLLEKVTVANPQFPGAFNVLGTALFKRKKYRESAASFRRAVEIEPNQTVFRFNLGIAEMMRQNKAGAVSQYNFLKKANPALAARMYRFIYSDKVVFVPGPDMIGVR